MWEWVYNVHEDKFSKKDTNAEVSRPLVLVFSGTFFGLGGGDTLHLTYYNVRQGKQWMKNEDVCSWRIRSTWCRANQCVDQQSLTIALTKCTNSANSIGPTKASRSRNLRRHRLCKHFSLISRFTIQFSHSTVLCPDIVIFFKRSLTWQVSVYGLNMALNLLRYLSLKGQECEIFSPVLFA
jgi:hypothetical protein